VTPEGVNDPTDHADPANVALESKPAHLVAGRTVPQERALVNLPLLLSARTTAASLRGIETRQTRSLRAGRVTIERERARNRADSSAVAER
jgi:hypothetical protein